MKPVMDEATARTSINEWAEYWEVEPSVDTLAALIPAVRRDHLRFDEESDSFIVKLRAPITQENGEVVREVHITEPEAGQLIGMKTADDMNGAMMLYSKLTGVPLGVVKRIKQRDLVTISGVVGFFS